MEAPERRDTCIWTYDADDCMYETECKQAFCYNDGDRADNGAFYCHHCGGLIEERGPRFCDECDEELSADEVTTCRLCKAIIHGDDA